MRHQEHLHRSIAHRRRQLLPARRPREGLRHRSSCHRGDQARRDRPWRRHRPHLRRTARRRHAGDLSDHLRAQGASILQARCRAHRRALQRCLHRRLHRPHLAGGARWRTDRSRARRRPDRDRRRPQARCTAPSISSAKIDERFSAEDGARRLAAREPRSDLAPHPALPDDTRLWAALVQASGGVWGGCVYDTDAIVDRLARGASAERQQR